MNYLALLPVIAALLVCVIVVLVGIVLELRAGRQELAKLTGTTSRDTGAKRFLRVKINNSIGDS